MWRSALRAEARPANRIELWERGRVCGHLTDLPRVRRNPSSDTRVRKSRYRRGLAHAIATANPCAPKFVRAGSVSRLYSLIAASRLSRNREPGNAPLCIENCP